MQRDLLEAIPQSIFLSKGVSVRCLVRRHHKSLGWIEKKDVEVQRGDLSEPGCLDELLHGIDTVIHVAGITKAKSPAEYYQEMCNRHKIFSMLPYAAEQYKNFVM